MKYGAKIYRYHGYLHAKTLVVDDDVCCIGSANFDTRSLQVNDEVCIFFYDKNFTQYNASLFREDLNHCSELDYNAFAKRSWRAHASEKLCRIFAPLL